MTEALATAYTIHIMGSDKPHNQSLRTFIDKELDCFVAEGMSRALPRQGKKNKELILINCLDDSYGCLRSELLRRGDGECLVVLLNFPRDKEKDEFEAILLGVRGVFYCGDSPGHISRGLKLIIEGELWFSRKIMSRCLIQGGISSVAVDSEIPDMLTFREQEILSMLKDGYSNMNIGKRLGISTHTVKTHVYNTYKKIKVTNRVQAIRWADQYLSS